MPSVMSEKVGWTRGASAAGVLGLYAGFMVAVAVSVIYNDDPLRSAGKAWALTMAISIVFLTPILSRGRKRGRPETSLLLNKIRDDLMKFDEGVNRWRSLSHVRREGTGVSIRMLDSKNPMMIVKQALPHSEDCNVQFRIKPSDDPELRARIIDYLSRSVGSSRISKKNHAITVTQPINIDRATLITRSMMIFPPLMLLGMMAVDSLSPGSTIARIGGCIAGLFLGIMIVTNRGR